MLSQFLYYLVGILAVVGGVLLLERIVAGPHDFGHRIRPRGQRLRLRSAPWEAVQRPSDQPVGPPRTLNPSASAGHPHDHWHPRDVGERLIPVASIVGSVDGASQRFDRNFGPSVTEPAPAWAASWSPCARASRSRPSKSGLGTVSTTYSTVTTGLQQRALWVATTSRSCH